MSDESTLRKAVTTALVFLENAVVTKGAVALRDVAGARPLITSLRAALAAPVSPPAPRGEAVEPWAFAVVRSDGTRYGKPTDDRSHAEETAASYNRDEVAGFPFRVVALVPQHEEPAT